MSGALPCGLFGWSLWSWLKRFPGNSEERQGRMGLCVRQVLWHLCHGLQSRPPLCRAETAKQKLDKDQDDSLDAIIFERYVIAAYWIMADKDPAWRWQRAYEYLCTYGRWINTPSGNAFQARRQSLAARLRAIPASLDTRSRVTLRRISVRYSASTFPRRWINRCSPSTLRGDADNDLRAVHPAGPGFRGLAARRGRGAVPGGSSCPRQERPSSILRSGRSC